MSDSLKRVSLPTLAALLVAIALVAAVPSFLGRYQVTVLVATLISLNLAVSFNIIGGLCGQISFGTAAFFGLGAYTQAILLSHGAPVAAGLIAAGIVASICSLVVIPCFRTSGLFFAIITLAISGAAQIMVQSFAPGGARGIYIPASPEPETAYYTLAALAAAALLASWLIKHSRFGLALQSIRDDEATAAEFGIETVRWKALALISSAFLAGVTGAAYAWVYGFVDPKTVMDLQYSLNPLLITIIGGAGAVLGPVFGSVVWALLGEVFRTITDNPLVNQMAYAVLLILLVKFAPYGIAGSWTRRFKHRKALSRLKAAALSQPGLERP